MPTQKQTFDLTFSTILKVALVVLGFVFLYLIKDVLAIVFLAIIIASTVGVWAGFFESFHLPRMLGVLLIYLFFIAMIGLVIYFVLPPVIDEIKQLAIVLPDYYDAFSAQVFKTTRGIAPDYAKDAQDFLAAFGDSIKGFTSSAVGAVSNLFGGVLAFVLMLVISFYLSVQKDGVQEFLRFVLPKSHEDYTLRLWHRVNIKLGKWLQGQLLLGLIVGTVVFIGLWFIGVPYALLLGLVAGVFEIIPIVGPLFSSLVGIAVATIISPALGIFTAIFYLIIQQSESHILVPLLMKKITGLNPVVVIIALLVGAKLGGVIGMLISVPLATIAGELFDDFAEQKSHS